MDKFGVASHQKAAAAIKAGKFKDEIVPLKGKDKAGNEIIHAQVSPLPKLTRLPLMSPRAPLQDEGVRPGVDFAAMQKLKSITELTTKGKKKGLITAGLASQICDGASAILICNDAGLKKLGVKPMAKIAGLTLAGADPVCMLSGPIPATEALLNKTGVTMDQAPTPHDPPRGELARRWSRALASRCLLPEQVGLYEVNEAFCSVPLAWAKALQADISKLNVNGGAMALGHPLGATGTKIMTTLVYEMQRTGTKYGIQAICEGGGTANATLLELCPGAKAKL